MDGCFQTLWAPEPAAVRVKVVLDFPATHSGWRERTAGVPIANLFGDDAVEPAPRRRNLCVFVEGGAMLRAKYDIRGEE